MRGSPLNRSSGAKTGDIKGSVVVISESSNVAKISSTRTSISSSVKVSSFAGIFLPSLSPGIFCLGKKGAYTEMA